jgi:hypothetical protein
MPEAMGSTASRLYIKALKIPFSGDREGMR